MEIKLDKILDYLPADKVAELGVIVGRICGVEGVAMVVLFGSYARGDYKLVREGEQKRVSDYDLLVVMQAGMDGDTAWYEMAGMFKDIGVHVQLVVEEIGLINGALMEKQYFYTDIKREGKVLFDTGDVQLADSVALTAGRRVEMATEDFEYWYSKVDEFWKYAGIAIPEGDLSLASFMLQQVVEMCYTCVEMVFDHYNPCEHDLEILRNRVMVYDIRFGDQLTTETVEKKILFKGLNFAYIGGRYRTEKQFPVCLEQIAYWRDEAEKVMSLTREVCEERIDCLRVVAGQ